MSSYGSEIVWFLRRRTRLHPGHAGLGHFISHSSRCRQGHFRSVSAGSWKPAGTAIHRLRSGFPASWCGSLVAAAEDQQKTEALLCAFLRGAKGLLATTALGSSLSWERALGPRAPRVQPPGQSQARPCPHLLCCSCRWGRGRGEALWVPWGLLKPHWAQALGGCYHGRFPEQMPPKGGCHLRQSGGLLGELGRTLMVKWCVWEARLPSLGE